MTAMFGSTAAGVLIIILLILVIILLIFCVNLSLNMNRLNRRYKLFMKGNDGKSLEKSMVQKFRALEKIQDEQKDQREILAYVRSQYDRSLTKYGMVKYDAFEDVGGKMSFALAMLDSNNTGFVLNAIHSKDNCYLYLKEVVKGESFIMLSEEEVQALRKAYHMGDENISAE